MNISGICFNLQLGTLLKFKIFFLKGKWTSSKNLIDKSHVKSRKYAWSAESRMNIFQTEKCKGFFFFFSEKVENFE